MRIRKDVRYLSPVEIQRLRNAVAELKASGNSAKNYRHFASIHGKSCAHACELFLPWHRAYIYEYEEALRQFEPEVTLPFWNWVELAAIPDLFAAPDPNPMFCERYTDEERRKINAQLPTQVQVDQVLRIGNFPEFGGGTPNFPYMGCLEQIHGLPHAWVGPTMADPGVASCDPIFWSHHSQVDRLWAVWQKNHGGLGPSTPGALLPGLDRAWTVADTLDTTGKHLGYEYAVDAHQFVTEEHTITDEPVLSEFQVPASFRVAEIRVEGVMSMARIPMQLGIQVGEDIIAIISLFGVHPHGMASIKPVFPNGVNPCFEPQEHTNPCGDEFNVRTCVAYSAFSDRITQKQFSTRIGLRITGTPHENRPKLMIKNAYILFK